jgi:gliding motility-associated-like protein
VKPGGGVLIDSASGQGISTTHGGDSLNKITFTKLAYNLGTAAGDTVPDGTGRVIFTINVKAVSDTGNSTTSGCTRDTTYRVLVEDSRAAFTIDSSVKIATGAAKFNFINKSSHVLDYYWDFGDSTPVYHTQNGGAVVTHTYNANPQMPNTLAEGLGQQPVIYHVKLTTISPFGCKEDTIEDVTILREYQHYNVFTPNGDGINDKFIPAIEGSTAYDIKIFNRWGQKVFESTNKDNNWDGNDQNTHQACPDGTYYYVWKFTIIGGIDKTINGAVTLLRK